MSMQNAQPLICEARILTSSSSGCSSPDSLTTVCMWNSAFATPGAALSQSSRVFMMSPVDGFQTEDDRARTPVTASVRFVQRQSAQLVGIEDAVDAEDALTVGEDGQ